MIVATTTLFAIQEQRRAVDVLAHEMHAEHSVHSAVRQRYRRATRTRGSSKQMPSLG